MAAEANFSLFTFHFSLFFVPLHPLLASPPWSRRAKPSHRVMVN